MNAAARLVHQGAFTRHLILTHLLTWRQISVVALALLVLSSAMSIIYVTHTTRNMYATYQRNLSERDRLHVEHGQLLLERSTLMMQSRIQETAETKLDMVTPDQKSVVIVRE